MLRSRVIGGSAVWLQRQSSHCLSTWPQAADDAFMTDGEGLCREGGRAGDRHGTARRPVRRRRAGSWSSTSRPTSATAARRVSATALQEAAKAIGWDFRILDGQGSVSGAHVRADPGDRAEAGRHHPRHDRRRRAGAADRAGGAARASRSSAGTPARAPGPIEGVPGVITNITTDPLEVAKAAGLYAVVDSGGKANVILFTDSIYAIATAKTNAEKAAVEGMHGLQGARRSRTRRSATSPTAWASSRRRCCRSTARSGPTRSPSTTSTSTSRRRRCRRPASIRRTAIRGRSRRATARCRRSSASVTSSIRSRPSPSRCTCTAGRCIDEMNRAFAGEPPSGFVAPRRTCSPPTTSTRTAARENIFDPGNGYRDQYKKIWGVK